MATTSQQQPHVKEGNPAERFDKIRYDDLSPEDEWTRLGKGSFGCVYKGEYLGIEVAIKEVLPSTEYEVEKYLQREITLMQQARHPNIVQYLGLCLAPSPPSPPSHPPSPPRILIISEFLPRGNLRQYILDRTLPFPWRLRVSFATDVARALAYLHARNTMHRDLKGENLLVSANERLKACDFGLARVAPGGGKEDEAWRRLTYCGTDGYMSPEILLGLPFTLQTDIFSLGILLLEIASRTLASSHAFVRSPPSYGIDEHEAWASASPLAPKAFVELALECCDTDPDKRPETKEILKRLREIEQEVLEQDAQGALAHEDAHSRGRSIKRRASVLAGANVGSVSFSGTTKKGSYGALAAAAAGGGGGRGTARPSAPRLPSFDGQVQIKFGSSFVGGVAPSVGATSTIPRASPSAEQAYFDAHSRSLRHHHRRGDDSASEEDEEALLALADADVDVSPPASLLAETLNLDAGDLGMDMRPDSAYFARLREESDSQEEGGGDYSISVVKPGTSSSFLSSAHGGSRPYGVLGSRSGSRLVGPSSAIIGGGAAGGGSLPSLPPSWVAASRQPSEDDGTQTVIATPPRSAEGTPVKADAARGGDDEAAAPSGWTARTSTLSVAQAVVGGHAVEPSVSSTALAVEDEGERTVFVSTLQSPARVRVEAVAEEAPEADEEEEEEEEVVEMPHRFSLVKPGLHRLFASLSASSSPSAPSLTSYSAGLGPSASSAKLSFQLAGGRTGTEVGAIDPAGSAMKEMNREGRCGLCEKKFGIMKAYLVCDDCGLACHIKCSDLIPPACPAYAASHPPSIAPTPPAIASPPLSPTVATSAPAPPKPSRAPPARPLSRIDANAAAGGGSRAGSPHRPSKLVKKNRPASVSGKGSTATATAAGGAPLSPVVG
ncbi:hypothetical protein JCM6882_004776 [Rhodosporidiobolus microsporus]